MTDTNKLTPGDRRELRTVVKNRFKVLRAEVKRREQEMKAEIEKQLLDTHEHGYLPTVQSESGGRWCPECAGGRRVRDPQTGVYSLCSECGQREGRS